MSMQPSTRWQVVATFALCSSLAIALGANAQSAPAAASRGALKVGVPLLGAPLAFRGEDGRPAGLLVEYWQAGYEHRSRVSITLCPTAADCLADLEAGALDLVGPMDIADRGDDVTFSAPVLSLPMGAASLVEDGSPRDARALRGQQISLLDLSGRPATVGDFCARGELCAALGRWTPAELRVVVPEDSGRAAASGFVVAPQAVLSQLFASEAETKVFTL